MKEKQFNYFLEELGFCQKCLNFKCSKKALINIYRDHNFATNIPSLWTDWFNRLDYPIMVIGQDWGPYKDMQLLNQEYIDEKASWNELIASEKSHTKKLLEYYLKVSSKGKWSIDKVFVTNAIMCARQGDNYRGDNIDLKASTLNCTSNLQKQIEIVKPKIILPLGYYPLLALAKIYNFPIGNNLRETIKLYPEIKVKGYVIIPLYHPVAQVKKEEQLAQYKRIWTYIDKE